MMQAAGMGCWLAPVAITTGEKATETSVPRVALTRMQLMAQTGVRRWLGSWSICRRRGGRRGGRESDDLALALGLACWKAKVR